ncbi:hypothetical protein QO002_002800 [Pararhizobium capsulatum DSM 1112]|uniref:Polyketide cyclase / dehydrase and lipid transport n=1 Tax=Pararhizobium capsulatum DSM 1112 TaxID=1121113 RepID=A0ABU0BUY1_9HYPH|nr:SRPBCC family protein [Pararhizobium capsulatum]MDQ0320662.1 hypothetical protein [Pararhizobium capsulatum DSM 1112]
MSVMTARIVHTSISKPWKEVYDFASNPENIPRWASGLSEGLERDGEDWLTGGPLGTAHVRFSPPNDFGVIDHLVTMADGTQVHNALRVVPNGDGAEVMFTLLKLAAMSNEDFERDARWVTKDLQTLKNLIEGEEHGPKG